MSEERDSLNITGSKIKVNQLHLQIAHAGRGLRCPPSREVFRLITWNWDRIKHLKVVLRRTKMKLEPDFFFTSQCHRVIRQGRTERRRDFSIRQGGMSVKLSLKAEFLLPPIFLSSLLHFCNSFCHDKVGKENCAVIPVPVLAVPKKKKKPCLHTLLAWWFGLHGSSVHKV